MGFKWFRARISMKKPTLMTTGVAGFYRRVSNYENCYEPRPPALKITKPTAIPVSPPQVPKLPETQNPMAMPSNWKTTGTTISMQENTQIEDNRLESFGDHLPRASVELIRNGLSSPKLPQRHKIINMKKTESKKKKARAPEPLILISNNNNDTMQMNCEEKSNKSEIVI